MDALLKECWIIFGQQYSKYHLAHRLPKNKILWHVQKLRRLSLLDSSIMPIQNNKMQPTSSFTFSPVQLYSTFD
jgi:hypothetical protein